MTARIYKPARNAMQSGQANTKEWALDYEPEKPRTIDPLMGWTSSTDMKQEVHLSFDTKEEAIAFCEREAIPYEVFETKPQVRPRISYSENFAYSRHEAWTH
jgi:ETC complex I subunit conserved region